MRGLRDLSRSTVYEHLSSFELRGRIYREKGRYWLPEQRRAEELTVDEAIRNYVWNETSEIIEKHTEACKLYDIYEPQEFFGLPIAEFRESYERTMLLASRLGINTERFRTRQRSILNMEVESKKFRRTRQKLLIKLMREAVECFIKEIHQVVSKQKG